MQNLVSKTDNQVRDFISTPYVIKKTKNGEQAMDIYTRLLEERIIFLAHEVTDDLASTVVAQLLYLEAMDPKKDIQIYINSPGGSISAGMAIVDTMNYIKCDVSTICMGMAASMGAFILAAGTKGKRFALPNSEIMIHQPLGGASGQATEMQINCEHILKIKKKMYEMLAGYTGQSFETIEKDCDRDHWLTADEAKKYGLIDKVITKH